MNPLPFGTVVMALILTPDQMDLLIRNKLEGYTLHANEITDHEDDGRLYRHLSFQDAQGQAQEYAYMWSPWDGNDYTIFASPDDAVQVKAAPLTPVVAAAPSKPTSSERAPVTHTLAEVKHDRTFQEAILDLHRRTTFSTPPTTIGEAKTLMRALAEHHGLSDRDVIDAVHNPRLCGMRLPKSATDDVLAPKARRRSPG
jgi:hypothetical protein